MVQQIPLIYGRRFIPIVEALAQNQIDPESGLEYHVDVEPMSLKAGLFG
jgi:hypothetical protein